MESANYPPTKHSTRFSHSATGETPATAAPRCLPQKPPTCTPLPTCPAPEPIKHQPSSVAPDCPSRNTAPRFTEFPQPRVAARFENGVLEAYSQFKLVFPEQQQLQQQQRQQCRTAQKPTQTGCPTRDLAVGVCSEEFRPPTRGRSAEKRSAVAGCPGVRNARVGTEEDALGEVSWGLTSVGIIQHSGVWKIVEEVEIYLENVEERWEPLINFGRCAR